MATGNLLLGQASGAVGSLVFARANGQQVTKARQEQVRYSNTLAQAIQRICISTAGQAYRHIQEVCCRSFQGIQPGKATHDEFMKRNVRLLRQSIRHADAQGLTYSDLRYFTPVGNDTLLPNAYIVALGSLPTITSNIISNDPTHARLAGVGSSYQDIISFYGLQRGDILTFVFMQPDSSGIVRARSARVVLDPWSPISGKASLDLPIIAANNKINCPNPDNSGEFTYLVNDSGNIIYSLVNSDVPLIAAGVFASRRTAAGSWLHSDCQLTVYDDSDILDKFTLQKAIDVANGAPIAAISPDYLNNAGTTPLPPSETPVIIDIDTITINQTISDELQMVSGDVQGEVIKAIRAASHLYLGVQTEQGNQVLCQLSDTDGTKFKDGTPASLDGSEGDQWLKLPVFWWKVDGAGTDEYSISFAIAGCPDSSWHKWEGDINLLAAKKMYVEAGKGYSRSGVVATANFNMQQGVDYAAARGDGYSLVTWEWHCMMCALFYAWYGRMNSQLQCGYGSNSNVRILGSKDSLGMNDTTNENGNQDNTKYFGIENWWGDIAEWIANISASDYGLQVIDMNTKEIRDTYKIVECGGSGGYISKMKVSDRLDFVPHAKNGSESTYYCDFVNSNGGSRVVYRGSYSASMNGGVSYANANIAPSYSNAYIGSRLAFHGNIQIIESVSEYRQALQNSNL